MTKRQSIIRKSTALGSMVSAFTVAMTATGAQAFAATGNTGVGNYMQMKSLNQLTDGLAWYGLIACVVGFFISAAMWAMGSKSQNPGTELNGKKGFIVCCAAAFAIGAAPGLVGWLQNESRKIDTVGVTANGPVPGSALGGGRVTNSSGIGQQVGAGAGQLAGQLAGSGATGQQVGAGAGQLAGQLAGSGGSGGTTPSPQQQPSGNGRCHSTQDADGQIVTTCT